MTDDAVTGENLTDEATTTEITEHLNEAIRALDEVFRIMKKRVPDGHKPIVTIGTAGVIFEDNVWFFVYAAADTITHKWIEEITGWELRNPNKSEPGTFVQ